MICLAEASSTIPHRNILRSLNILESIISCSLGVCSIFSLVFMYRHKYIQTFTFHNPLPKPTQADFLSLLRGKKQSQEIIREPMLCKGAHESFRVAMLRSQ